MKTLQLRAYLAGWCLRAFFYLLSVDCDLQVSIHFAGQIIEISRGAK